jgi:hypothetical protein
MKGEYMRKMSVLLAALLMVVAIQSASAGLRPNYGIKAGLVLADQDWEYDNILGSLERDCRTGFAAGVFIDFALVPNLGLRPEVLYVQKGSRVDVRHLRYDDIYGSTTTFTDRIDYLSFVLNVKLKTGNGPFGLYVFGGPRVDLKAGTSTDAPDANLEDILDSYKSTVNGLTFGLGLERALGGIGPVLLEARYDYDFGEAARHVGSEATLTIDNRSFAVLVGLAL